MWPSGLRGPHERELEGGEPVLISVGRAEANLRSEMDGMTAALWRREERQRRAFGRERAAVRSFVDSRMQELLEGVRGVLPPCVLDPPVLAETNTSAAVPQPPQKESVKQMPYHYPQQHNPPILPSASPYTSNAKKKQPLPFSCKGSRMVAGALDNEMSCVHPHGRIPRGGRKAMPRGFPLPFEESGFQCMIHWAETSFQEVALAALGPCSQRLRKEKTEPNNRFLVSVACYLLNELLSREAKFSKIWPQLQEIIYNAVFQPQVVVPQSTTPRSEESEILMYPRFQNREDYADLHLWSDSFLASRAENAQLSKRIEDLVEVVKKSHLVLRFARRRVNQIRLEHVFCAWRKSVQRDRTFREAAMAYFSRVRQRLRIEGCFLRWRRVAAQSQVAELLKIVKESEVRLAFMESSNDKKMDTLLKKLEEEQKLNFILKMKKEALKSQLAESHVIALCAIETEIEQQQASMIQAKKQGKRWERLAKTFTFPTECVMIPSSLRKHALALRRMEDSLALKKPNVHDHGPEVRRALEVFLLDWVNYFMTNSAGGVFWRSVVKIDTGLNDGDFGPVALLQFVRALDALYVSKGSPRVECVFSPLKHEDNSQSLKQSGNGDSSMERTCETLFIELRRLIYLQTMEGLFPPLLTHCTFLDTFFTPSLFCQRPHPSAVLWVLSSLFVGYTRLICGGPVTVEQEVDASMRCMEENALRTLPVGSIFPKSDYFSSSSAPATSSGAVVTPAAAAGKEGAHGGGYRAGRRTSRVVVASNHTVIQKHPRSKQLRRNSTRKVREYIEEAERKREKDVERLADTTSDLEVYLGLEEKEEEDSDSDSACGDDNNKDKKNINDSDSSNSSVDDSFSSANKDEGNEKTIPPVYSSSEAGSEMTKSVTPRIGVESEAAEREKRVKRKAHLMPPMNASMCSFSLREFVECHRQQSKRKRLWIGFSRVISSLVVRFHILDVGIPQPEEKKPISLRKSFTSRGESASVSMSRLHDSSYQSRRSVALVPSFS